MSVLSTPRTFVKRRGMSHKTMKVASKSLGIDEFVKSQHHRQSDSDNYIPCS